MWYYVDAGAQQGPVDESAFRSLIASGAVTTSTLVWREGMPDWVAAGESPLAGCFHEATTPHGAAMTGTDSPLDHHHSPAPLSWPQIFWSFRGRIARRHYWAGQLVWIGGLLVLVAIYDGFDDSGSGEGWTWLSLLVFFAFYFWSSLALQVKRWHDRDKSGAWVLINFIPYIGGLWSFIECGCLRGTEGPNRYGNDPT